MFCRLCMLKTAVVYLANFNWDGSRHSDVASEIDEQAASAGLLASVREAVSLNAVLMLMAGGLAGASVVSLDEQAIVVPVVGAVPGWLLGGVGLLVAGLLYNRQGGCNCSGDCGDSCSV